MTATQVHEYEEHDNPENAHLIKRVASDQYTITELLHEGATAALYRGVRQRDGWSVLIKALRAASPTPRDIECLRREYEIGQHIDSPYVLKPYALERCGAQLLLIVEDYGGKPLARWLGVPLELG